MLTFGLVAAGVLLGGYAAARWTERNGEGPDLIVNVPGGAILGSLTGAITFGVLAVRDTEIAIERPPKPPRKP